MQGQAFSTNIGGYRITLLSNQLTMLVLSSEICILVRAFPKASKDPNPKPLLSAPSITLLTEMPHPCLQYSPPRSHQPLTTLLTVCITTQNLACSMRPPHTLTTPPPQHASPHKTLLAVCNLPIPRLPLPLDICDPSCMQCTVALPVPWQSIPAGS